MFSAVTLVLWLGARSVLHGTMTGGELAQFLSYAIFMATSVTALSEMWGEFSAPPAPWNAPSSCCESRPSIRDAREARRTQRADAGRSASSI